jgi:hypothetical protein
MPYLYKMEYSTVLPSAVYFYHATGEVQHHFSRTIEEFFELMGYKARKTDSFDPKDYLPNRVAELWESRELSDEKELAKPNSTTFLNLVVLHYIKKNQ